MPACATPLRPAWATGAAPARQAAAARRDVVAALLLCLPIVTVTFLAKLSVPPLGSRGLGLDVPLLLLVTVAGLCLARFQLHTGRFLAYVAMLTWLGGVQLVRGDSFSAASMGLLAALFLPLILQLRPSPQGAFDADPLAASLRTMTGLATVFALCGVLQYGGQYLVGPRLAFPMEHGVPDALLIEKFNTLIPVHPGSAVFKSNGIFFLEPSFYSQFIALGLLLELSLRNRPLRILLLLVALAVSYSGTGLIVAAVGGAGLVIVKRRWDLVALAAVIALVVGLLFADALQPLLGRAAEFRSPHSSGSARFVAWVDLFNQHWWTDVTRVLFGTGAGSFPGYAATARQPTAEMSFSKMLFEFGLVGATLFFGFLAYAINSVRAPLAFRLGLVATLFVNGAYVAFPVGIAASILLWPAAGRRGAGTPIAPAVPVAPAYRVPPP